MSEAVTGFSFTISNKKVYKDNSKTAEDIATIENRKKDRSTKFNFENPRINS